MSQAILLGMGSCVDAEVQWDADALSELASQWQVDAGMGVEHEPVISSTRALVQRIVDCLRRGAGGEWHVDDPVILTQVSAHFATRVSLGGSNVRAAIALDRLGRRSTVHLAHVDDQVRELLPRSVEYLHHESAAPSYPHLIVQYPQGAVIEIGGMTLTAPRANRLIFVHDPANSELRVAPDFGEAAAHARLIMISGFNTIESEDLLRRRIEELIEYLRARPADAMVVYEDAAFHHDERRAVITRRLAAEVDLWSMNEDEVAAYLNMPFDPLDATAVDRAARSLRAHLGVRTVIVHSGEWALAHGDVSGLTPALELGVKAATARYVHGDQWNVTDFRRFPCPGPEDGGAVLADRIEALGGGHTAVVPVPQVQAQDPTTIGLGDTFLGGLLAGLALARDV
ncbi:ADP-dependent glucokinase/phosphofructokinase [Bogoriella caseilytica]|uniref:ADP-dependent phosphofructokinase/glucokinase n=1 Tax=Bogoriella caseilytica TaxID=56055 RepID=A0A3N2BD42_9MICO|nr:ADP-dependent glucokinase/phosphofructokinase [Bogoriella caseilytica]ROR73152.1 ADP-dependent phosphofructokinase/glucokinase [Bogoriella caseilytica]